VSEDTQVDVLHQDVYQDKVDGLHQDVSVHQPSSLSDLLGASTSMDVDVDVQEFPHLTLMDRQYLTVPPTSPSPQRLFSSVGLVKSDLWGDLLDTTLIDVMWVEQVP
jgi:hypothetical protein